MRYEVHKSEVYEGYYYCIIDDINHRRVFHLNTHYATYEEAEKAAKKRLHEDQQTV